MKPSILYGTAIAILMTGGGLLLYIAFLLFYPFIPLTIKEPVPVLTKTVKAGSDLVYQADYCKYDQAGAKVYRTLVGPTFVPTPAVDTVTSLGCRKAIIHLKVPETTEPGVYHMDILAEFQVNQLRTVSLKWRSEDFTVTP